MGASSRSEKIIRCEVPRLDSVIMGVHASRPGRRPLLFPAPRRLRPKARVPAPRPLRPRRRRPGGRRPRAGHGGPPGGRTLPHHRPGAAGRCAHRGPRRPEGPAGLRPARPQRAWSRPASTPPAPRPQRSAPGRPRGAGAARPRPREARRDPGPAGPGSDGRHPAGDRQFRGVEVVTFRRDGTGPRGAGLRSPSGRTRSSPPGPTRPRRCAAPPSSPRIAPSGRARPPHGRARPSARAGSRPCLAPAGSPALGRPARWPATASRSGSGPRPPSWGSALALLLSPEREAWWKALGGAGHRDEGAVALLPPEAALVLRWAATRPRPRVGSSPGTRPT